MRGRCKQRRKRFDSLSEQEIKKVFLRFVQCERGKISCDYNQPGMCERVFKKADRSVPVDEV